MLVNSLFHPLSSICISFSSFFSSYIKSSFSSPAASSSLSSAVGRAIVEAGEKDLRSARRSNSTISRRACSSTNRSTCLRSRFGRSDDIANERKGHQGKKVERRGEGRKGEEE